MQRYNGAGAHRWVSVELQGERCAWLCVSVGCRGVGIWVCVSAEVQGCGHMGVCVCRVWRHVYVCAQVTELIREQGVPRLWGGVSPGGYEVEQGLLWMQKDCPWVRQTKESLSGDACGEAPTYLLLVSGPPAPAWGSRTHSKVCALAAPRPSWAPEPSRSPAAGWCTSRAGGSGQGLGEGSHLRRTPPPRAGSIHTQASGHPQDHKASRKELGLFGVGDGEVGSNHQREDGHPGPPR